MVYTSREERSRWRDGELNVRTTDQSRTEPIVNRGRAARRGKARLQFSEPVWHRLMDRRRRVGGCREGW